MSNLLQIVRVKPDAMTKKGVTPLILEFTVDPQTAPYLVSATTGLLWVDTPHPADRQPVIKAAVRKGVAPGDLFWEAAKAIYARSLEAQWGSAHPFTSDGVEAAIEHVESYDLGQVDILVSPTTPTKKRPVWLLEKNIGHHVRSSSWVPDNCAIIVPTDRQFVGMLVHLTPTIMALAVHNPSRGVAVCWDGGVSG